MDIGEVVERSGLPASTLRYYEEKGLIQSIGRKGLRRVFDKNIIERLGLIILGRDAGFSLEEVSLMFSDDGSAQIDKGKLLLKANDLDAKIKQLTMIRNGLVHAAQCKAPSHMQCKKFRRLVRTATNKAVAKQA